MASIDFIYQNEYQKEISFPLGGIGSGCVGLSGDGRLIDWELHSRPNKQSVNGFTHFAIKAQQGNHVLGARVLQSDTRKDFMGFFDVKATMRLYDLACLSVHAINSNMKMIIVRIVM